MRRGDAARGEPGDRQPPPAAAAGPGVRHRHPVLLRRATVPGAGQVADRPGRCPSTSAVRASRPTPTSPTSTPPSARRSSWRPSARRHYVLDEILGNATDLPDHRARHRHPRRDPGQLRPVRPGRAAALAADPGPGQDHPVPDRARRPGPRPLPARRAAADPPGERRSDRRALGRPAAPGRVAEVRARHRVADRRQAARRRAGRTRWPPRSRSTGRCAARSTPPATCPTRSTGARSPASSTRASPCTRCSATCSTPTRAPSGPGSCRQQTEQAWCLTLVTNAVVAWTTEYYGLAVDVDARRGPARRRRGAGPHLPGRTARTSTSSAPIGSTSTPSSPSSARPATGRCACATPCSDPGQRAARRPGSLRHPTVISRVQKTVRRSAAASPSTMRWACVRIR